MATIGHLSLEVLPNGLVRVYDRRAGWAACYSFATGAYRHGAPDNRQYREAVEAFRHGLV